MTNPAGLMNVTQDFAPAGSAEGIELRIIPLLLFLADALLKFIWSHRLFGFCAIMMAAVPNDPADLLAYHRAAQAAEGVQDTTLRYALENLTRNYLSRSKAPRP